MFSSLHFDPFGTPVSDTDWDRRRNEWLPAPADREYLLSIMAEPVYEPGKFANYIAPPIRGIHRMPVNFEYVRTEM
jgi:benzoyl-CoA 2,3-epoxidase subunit B